MKVLPRLCRPSTIFFIRKVWILSLTQCAIFFDAFDDSTENDNNSMLFFLQERLERFRHQVNPISGIMVIHHTKKMTKKLLEEDPFQCLSGSGALRGFYTTGMILFRHDETKTPRQLIFELRNGERIDNKWVDKMGGKWSIFGRRIPSVWSISITAKKLGTQNAGPSTILFCSSFMMKAHKGYREPILQSI